MSAQLTILQGDCLQVLATLPDGSIDCIVTSPPYWNQRDYGEKGQIGLEPTPEQYIAVLVKVFSECRRILKARGTFWLNIGDTYANDLKWGGSSSGFHTAGKGKHKYGVTGGLPAVRQRKVAGLPSKSLIGIPWMLAFALRNDGWILRQENIWHKPNPLPEGNISDRPHRAHEQVFLFSKSGRYHYDAEAVKEKTTGNAHSRGKGQNPKRMNADRRFIRCNPTWEANEPVDKRNLRSVWTVPVQGVKEAHFATYPEKLIEPCILAGCPKDGTVLDPFGGSGTTARVALRHGRNCTLIELKPEYVEIIKKRVYEPEPEPIRINEDTFTQKKLWA